MEIRTVTKGSELRKIGARTLMDFINGIIAERAYIMRAEKVGLEEERIWLREKAKSIDAKQCVVILLLDEDRLAGTCEVWRGKFKEKHNVHFGLSVAKNYRGKGYGELLLKRAIEAAEKYFKPHAIWIEHIEGNYIARSLYEKLGFREVARLKEYVNHFGEWKDKILMRYDS